MELSEKKRLECESHLQELSYLQNNSLHVSKVPYLALFVTGVLDFNKL